MFRATVACGDFRLHVVLTVGHLECDRGGGVELLGRLLLLIFLSDGRRFIFQKVETTMLLD